MKRYLLILSLLMFIGTAASAQRFRGGGFHGGGYAYHGGGYRGGYGYGGYRNYGGLYLGLGLGWGLGYYYNPYYYYGYPYYGYPNYYYPPAYQQAPPPESNPRDDSYNGSGNRGGYYNNDTIYSQKPATPGPGPTENNGSPSRQWIPAHWKHTDEGWIWIDGYYKNQ